MFVLSIRVYFSFVSGSVGNSFIVHVWTLYPAQELVGRLIYDMKYNYNGVKWTCTILHYSYSWALLVLFVAELEVAREHKVALRTRVSIAAFDIARGNVLHVYVPVWPFLSG